MVATHALSGLLNLPLLLLFVFPLGSFLVTKQRTVSMLDMYTSYGKDTTRVIQIPFLSTCLVHGLRFQLHGGRRTFLQGQVPYDVDGVQSFQIRLSGDIHPNPGPSWHGIKYVVGNVNRMCKATRTPFYATIASAGFRQIVLV